MTVDEMIKTGIMDNYGMISNPIDPSTGKPVVDVSKLNPYTGQLDMFDSLQETINNMPNILNPYDNIHLSWKPIIEEFLNNFLIQGKLNPEHKANALFEELSAGYNPNSSRKVTVYPREEDVHKAYKLGIDKIKVVILGQDPYHGGQAHGLAFSSMTHYPGSLRVIFDELQKNTGLDRRVRSHLERPCNLIDWHNQGIMLLNSCLTVEAGKAGSHVGLGWEELTTTTLRTLIIHKNPKVFVTWGKKAQETFDNARGGFLTEDFFRNNNHINLRAPHPAADLYPSNGVRPKFIGCGHFNKIDKFIKDHYGHTIQWG